MIKLKDLKIGNKIYGISSDGTGLYAESIVQQELFMLDISPNPIEAVSCKGGLDIVSRSYENYIFRTEKEADTNLNILQIKLAKELLKSDKFMDRLFEYATSPKRLSKYEEIPIYKIALKLYKEHQK